MSKIIEVLAKSNSELITDGIAYLLADELANQKILNETMLAAELAKLPEDQNAYLISLYNLNIDSIPDRVYTERNNAPTPKESPMLNVIYTGRDNELTNRSVQMGESSYIIEGFTISEDTDTEFGDELSSMKQKRMMSIVRSIIMDPNYIRLGFWEKDEDGVYTMPIGSRHISEEKFISEKKGAEDAFSYSYGSMDLKVKISEGVFLYEGYPWKESSTIVKINDTELGHSWIHIDGLRGDEIVTINNDMLKLNNEYVTQG